MPSFRGWLSRLLPDEARRALASLAGIEETLGVNRREMRRLRQQVEALVKTQEKQQRQQHDLRELINALQKNAKLRSKWETGVSWQLNAVVRRLFLPADIPLPYRLAAHRFKLRSQHEEDGYLLALLDEVGATDRRFVEIGSGRSGGNAAVLAFELGWTGLMVDANPAGIAHIKKFYAPNDGVTGVVARVTPENINALLEEHGYRGEVDLLSIDIDSFDYWVFDALEVCSPRILMLEYNAGFGPDRAVTIPRDAVLKGAPKGYSGASLAALTKLAARKGYRLVACEYSGANAFFLRNDFGPSLKAQSVDRAYRPQMSRMELDVERRGPDEVLRRIAELNLPLVDV